MFAFSHVVTVLCTSMNVGCSQLGLRPIRVTSLVPYYDNYNEAFSGNFSSNTTNLVKKLKNPANFGPNGIVKIQRFEFKELNLEKLDIATGGDEVVKKTLAETDILYIGAVYSAEIAKFRDEIMTYVQNKSVVLLLALSYEWQNFYAEDFGYMIDQKDNCPPLPVKPTSDFKGPFGEPKELFVQLPIIQFVNYTKQATPILKDSVGVLRGMQEDSKLLLGDGRLLLNTYIKDKSDRCDSDDFSIFACNVFGSLVQKVRDTKP